jgi:SAM-dependent methyltransferase
MASIAARREAEGSPNLLEPVKLDASDAVSWPAETFDAVVCINMIHIAPWAAAEGLMRGATAVLPAGGLLYLYGPYREGGEHTAPSNAAFDESLRARDPSWGVRDLEEVAALAERSGLAFEERIGMPANNLSLWFRKA